MSQYDELLKEAKAKAEAFALTAREYIPKMYDALRTEDSNHSPEDARDRIEKDCLGIWSKRTILYALPDEAKDLKKQKAGRLCKKEHVTAAFSAAPELPKSKKREIVTDTQGKSIDEFNEPIIDDHYHHHHHYSQKSSNINKQSQNVDILDFEFSVYKGDVWGFLIDSLADEDDSKENKQNLIWFTGTIDRCSGKVISAAIGRLNIAQQAV